jgi:DivIVA domain-containing protein
MVPRSHAGPGYSEARQSPLRSGLLGRLGKLLRPPLPMPLTATLDSPPVSDSATGALRLPSLVRLHPDDVRNVRFRITKWREGYSQDDVDNFLDRVESQLRTGTQGAVAPLTAKAVIDQRFGAAKFRPGYDQDEVDDFLDRIVTELRRQG